MTAYVSKLFSPFPKEDEVFRLLFPGLVVFEVTYSYN